MISYYPNELELAGDIYYQIRFTDFNIDTFNNYIDKILVSKFKDKKVFLEDNVLNLISTIIFNNNSCKKEFISALKDKMASNNMLEYLENINIKSDNEIEALLYQNNSRGVNGELLKLYGCGYNISYDLCVKLLFYHFNNPNFNLDRTSIKLILESLCYDKLDELGIDNHLCFYFDDKSINEDLLGEYSDDTKTVLLNDRYIDRLVNFDMDNIDENTFSGIETVFHECEHANQFIGKKDFSLENLIIQKDLLLKWYGPSEFYDKNYREISFEILARKRQVIDTFKLLAFNDPIISDKYYDIMERKLEKENELLEETINENRMVKVSDDKLKESADELIGNLLNNFPNLYKTFPLLSYEYENGKRKSISNIISSIDGLEKNSNYYEYTFSLLRSGKSIGKAEKLNTLRELSLINTSDPVIIKQICYVLCDNINRLNDSFNYDYERLNNDYYLSKFKDDTSYIESRINDLKSFKDILESLNGFCEYDNIWSKKLSKLVESILTKLDGFDFEVTKAK
jgi:hypothetical protein